MDILFPNYQPNAQPIQIIACEFVEGWGMYRYRCTEEDGSPVPLLFAASDLAPLDNFIPNATNPK